MVDGLVPMCWQFKAPRGLSDRKNRPIGGVMRVRGPREVGVQIVPILLTCWQFRAPRGLSDWQNLQNRPICGVLRGRGSWTPQPEATQVGRIGKSAHQWGYGAGGGSVRGLGLLDGANMSICPGSSLWGYHFVVAMVIHRHISTHRQSSKKGVRWPKLSLRGQPGVWMANSYRIWCPPCPLKILWLDYKSMCQWLAMGNITQFYSKNRSWGSVMLLDPWMSP